MRSRWDSIMEDIFFSGISIINSRLSRNNLTIMSPFIQVWCLVCLRQHIRQSPREKSHVESIICSFMHSVRLGFQINMHTWYMSHRISKAWPCLRQDHMVSRTLAACSTSGRLQLITFHQLEAFTGTVLLLDTSWKVGWFGGGGKGKTARWRGDGGWCSVCWYSLKHTNWNWDSWCYHIF